jgi:hypothetical protein
MQCGTGAAAANNKKKIKFAALRPRLTSLQYLKNKVF